MDDRPNGREDELDLGGERACWLDEVCASCGAVGGHRAGWELAESEDDLVTPVARISTPAPGPADDVSTGPEFPVERDIRTV